MALIQTVYAGDLYHMADRMGRGHNFGYKGWRAIGEYLESLSDDIGGNVEIDIIALCCDYSMAESADGVFHEYDNLHGVDLPEDETWEEMSEDEKLETIEDFLRYNTSLVICEDDLIIWQAF